MKISYQKHSDCNGRTLVKALRGSAFNIIHPVLMGMLLLAFSSDILRADANVEFYAKARVHGEFRVELDTASSHIDDESDDNCYTFIFGATNGVELVLNEPYVVNISVEENACYDEGKAIFKSLSSCLHFFIDGVDEGTDYTYTTDTAKTSESFTIELRHVDNLTVNFSVDPLPPDGRSTSWASVSLPEALVEPITWSIESTNDLGCTIVATNGLITAGTNIGTILVRATGDDDCYAEGLLDLDWCNSCGSGNCSPGTVSASLAHGVQVSINLGVMPRLENAGKLHIGAILPSADLYTRRSLEYNYRRGEVDTVWDEIGLRQVRTPLILADIKTVSDTEYNIQIFLGAALKGISTIFPTNGTLLSTITVENPQPANNNKIKITETWKGEDTVYLYEYDDTTLEWELDSADGERLETEIIGKTNEFITVTYKTLSPTEQPLYVKTTKYETNLVGKEIVEEKIGTLANALVTTYSYYSDGNLEEVNYSDGSWKRFIYDAQDRPIFEYSSWLNQAPTTNSSLCRVLEYDYSTNVVDESGDIGTRALGTPRRTVEKILGTEVSRTYRIIAGRTNRVIRAQRSGAPWDASHNMVASTIFHTNGVNLGKPIHVHHPDGTKDVYSYAESSSGYTTNEVYSGIPDSIEGDDDLYFGTHQVIVYDNEARKISNKVYAVYNSGEASCLIDSKTYSDFDDVGRASKVTYLDGTTDLYLYGCCGLTISTNRLGTKTFYFYDDLKRLIRTEFVTEGGLSTSNVLDAAGNILASVRIGTDDSEIETTGYVYDDSGRVQISEDAFNNQTKYTNYFDGSGYRVEKVTYPDGSIRIDKYFKDGSIYDTSGTAVSPATYSYGVEAAGTNIGGINIDNLYTKVERGTSTEWTKTYFDMIGRAHKMVYAKDSSPYPFSQSFYQESPDGNGFNQGKLIREFDADGVITLYEYDNYDPASNQVHTVAIDMNQDGDISKTSLDRITETQTTYHDDHGDYVKAILTYTYPTDNNSTRKLVSMQEQGVDGIESWFTDDDLTTHSITSYEGSGKQYITNTAPNGTYTITYSLDGKLQSNTRYDGDDTQIGKTSYTYDSHDRQITITDDPTGTKTTLVYNEGDQTITNKLTGTGLTDQITINSFDEMGRIWKVEYPDSTSVTNTFYDTGLLKKTVGSRTYPVEYDYDSQGRMTNMITWQDYAGDTGKATNSWVYDGYRGYLTKKLYTDGKGPQYTYTAGGRLKTRVWARGITTTYDHNEAGDVDSIDYSDTTDDLIFTHTRLGQVKTVVQGSMTTTLAYNDAGSITSETHSGGILDGLGTYRTYDTTNNVIEIYHHTSYKNEYEYDAAGRMHKLNYGPNTISYAYKPNSQLITNILHKFGTTNILDVSKQYDNFSRLTYIASHLSEEDDEIAANFSYTYNQANQRTKNTYADSSYWEYAYDDLGQVISGKKYWSDGSPVAGQQFEYQFDDIGNRETSKSGGDHWGTQLRTTSYDANSLNQYQSRSVPGYVDIMGEATNTATVTVNNELTYRKTNYFRKELSVTNNLGPIYLSVTNFAVIDDSGDKTNSVIGSIFIPQNTESFTYDDDGNLTSDGRWTYTWNAENRLISLVSHSTAPTESKRLIGFFYDYKGRRISKVVSNYTGTAWEELDELKFLYDDWNLLAELDGDDTRVRNYVWGLDLSGSLQGAGGVGGLHSIDDASEGLHHVGCDGNGNVTVIVDGADGHLAGGYGYDPFGNCILELGNGIAAMNHIRFSSQYVDFQTDQYYYTYRYYNPVSATWLSRDPYADKLDLDGLPPTESENLYLFVGNNGIINIDMLGLYTLSDAEKIVCSPCKRLRGRSAITRCLSRCQRTKKSEIFEQWTTLERGNNNWWTVLPKCPRKLCIQTSFHHTPSRRIYTINRAENPDPNVWENPGRPFPAEGLLHPGTVYSLRSKPVNRHSNQCTYDQYGNLLMDIASAGTVDFRAPGPVFGNGIVNYPHYDHDVEPVISAANLDGNKKGLLYGSIRKVGKYVKLYYEVRPHWHE